MPEVRRTAWWQWTHGHIAELWMSVVMWWGCGERGERLRGEERGWGREERGWGKGGGRLGGGRREAGRKEEGGWEEGRERLGGRRRQAGRKEESSCLVQ